MAASAGFSLARSPEEADIVVVNTCSFIRDAREESIAAILDSCELKRTGRAKAVLVAGCLPQRYQARLASALPEVDAFIGLDEATRVDEILSRLVRGQRRISEISAKSKAMIEPTAERPIFTGAPFAYMKIAEGCDHACSFCAIPKIRGRHRSRPMKSLLAEAEGLLARGFRELVLVSQDTFSYGHDLGGSADLRRLLRELGKIGGRFWIRVLYGHPAGLSRELLETMANVPQVCHYLDLPVQHADDDILRAMNRRESGKTLRRMFGEIREILPDAALRTTFLVGFPGETEKSFQNLLDFLREIRFDHAGVFVFSREENTRAWNMRAPPRALAEERRARLLLAQQAIVRETARSRIGKRDLILVEKPRAGKPGSWESRSRRLAPEVDGLIILQSRSRHVAPGAFVEARYSGYRGYDMRAVEI